MSNIDDAFMAFAEQQEAEAAKRQSRGSNSSSQPREYEVIKWSGLEQGTMTLFRFLGGVPDSKQDNFTAKTVRVSRIIDDNGKVLKAVFPDRTEAPDHILWRIINRVNQTEWQEGKKVFPVKEKYPTIYETIKKNGVSPTDKRYIFERGWEGRHVLIANGIDRANYQWHQENKHSMLLSRSVNVSKDGVEYAEDGVPSYGFVNGVANLFRFYGSWEKFDIGIERTGLKESPYRIINASKHIEEVPKALQGLVSGDPLTEEELSWERYDLNRLFGYTSSTKLLNRLRNTVALIDGKLGTNFLKELEEASEAEKAQWEKEKGTAEITNESVAETKTKQAVVDKPKRVVKKSDTPFDATQLPAWSKLSAAEKDAIADVHMVDGVPSITYKDPDAVLLACPSCEVAAPDSFVTCPNCGESFA